MTESLGFKWISEQTGIAPTQPFKVTSRLGTNRKSLHANGFAQEVYPAQFRPEPTIPGHLTFALKYEIVHLEFLSRLFSTLEPGILEEWIRDEPTGSFARRVGFLYEWLTGKLLDVPDAGGNYIEALPEDKYLTAARPVNHQRWRVRDNMPGNPSFCPIVYRSRQVETVEGYDCAKALNELEVEYGAHLLMRSAVWLTIKESRASFAIEHEEKQVDRIKRFAAAMAERCGKGNDPLDTKELTDLQTAILGRATRYGLRKSPVFVGHTSGYAEIVDYVAPHWDHTSELLNGLQEFLSRTRQRSSILRAAVASFGFVYINPMADGNGRISRFLVNDVLRRDGAVPEPFILPISATITNTTKAKAGYDHTLEELSKPLLDTYKDRYKFGQEVPYEDGVVSNFHFDAYDEALHVWKYPDLTAHAEYMGEVIQMTIQDEMNKEAMYLRNLERAREGVKNWLEGPNTDIDRIIRSVSQGGAWKVSNKLAKEFPALAEAEVAENVVKAVREAFNAGEPEGGDEESSEL
ncbi:Fic family protein [Noviherbaspirillum sedimenti]|nr:Fic family protein [Noviherbaspirillum sedimenti]